MKNPKMATKMQYIPKYFKLFFWTIEIMYLQAKSPEINEVKKAITSPLICESSNCINEELNNINSKKVTPMMGNSTIINANSAAFCLSIFRNKAAEIVAPDLEIPGNIAKACARPIRNA